MLFFTIDGFSSLGSLTLIEVGGLGSDQFVVVDVYPVFFCGQVETITAKASVLFCYRLFEPTLRQLLFTLLN